MSRRFYHRTTATQAESILHGGFETYKVDRVRDDDVPLRGVFLSNTPSESLQGDLDPEVREVLRTTTIFDDLLAIPFDMALLEVIMPIRLGLEFFELPPVAEPGFREWCVPAVLIDRYGAVRRLDRRAEDDVFFEENYPTRARFDTPPSADPAL